MRRAINTDWNEVGDKMLNKAGSALVQARDTVTAETAGTINRIETQSQAIRASRREG